MKKTLLEEFNKFDEAYENLSIILGFISDEKEYKQAITLVREVDKHKNNLEKLIKDPKTYE